MNQSKSNLVSHAERILGYHFREPSLLEQALTHGSYSNGTISYERLEFIGDAALNLAMANYLNVTYPDLKPGHISKLRSANVSNEKLARDAVRKDIYPLVQIIYSPKLKKKVKKFAEAVKQEPEDEIYGGTTKKAPKFLADVIEAIAAAIYQDCNFNLDMMWKVVKKLLEPLITADTFDEQPVTALTEFCQKNGKDLQFVGPSREGKKTIFEVLIDDEKVGYGSSKNKYIAKLNAARDALEKLNVEKSNLSIKTHKEVEDGEKSTLQAPTIPQSQHQLAALSPLRSLSSASPHEKIETKEKKEYHSVELRPTRDDRDKIEKVRTETVAKQKRNELCVKRHQPPPEYQSETKGMSAKGEKGKGEGHVADPSQHQHPKPALSPGLTASAQPAPELEESTKYEESEESTESEESEEDIPFMDKVDSYQRKTGYNVTVEGRERRERRVPCCRIDIGWLLFILGFFLGGPWLIGAIMLCFSRVDYREKSGYIGCTIATVLFLVLSIILEREKELIIGDLRLLSDKKELMIGDFSNLEKKLKWYLAPTKK